MTTSQPEPDPADSGQELERKPFPASFDLRQMDLDELREVFTTRIATEIQDAAGTSPSLKLLAQGLESRFDWHRSTLKRIRQRQPLDPEEVWALILDFHQICNLIGHHASHLGSVAQTLLASGQLNRLQSLEEVGQKVDTEADALIQVHRQLTPVFWRNLPALQELARAMDP
jgi:hypothetical protein